MSRLPICVVACLLSLGASARYTGANLSDDSHVLTLTTTSGTFAAPLTAKDQVGFSDPAVSSDGSIVGWLALTPNCCTSYPLPTSLVLFTEGKVIQTFDVAPPIWQWIFSEDNTAVAYRQEFPHGSLAGHYALRRIADGALLEEFTCDPQQLSTAGEAPGWVAPILVHCVDPSASPPDAF